MIKKSPASSLGGYTFKEEVANSVTHGIAALLSAVGLYFLLEKAVSGTNEAMVVLSAAVFGSAAIILYLISTLYHAVGNKRAKRILQIFDHSAIYLMIAGSYTPFCLVTLADDGGLLLGAFVWAVALSGMICQPVLIKRAEWLNCVLYLLLGWCVVFKIGALVELLPAGGLWLLVAGGVVYSLGVIFYLCEKIPFNHAIWHLFVAGGTALQFFAVFCYVIPE